MEEFETIFIFIAAYSLINAFLAGWFDAIWKRLPGGVFNPVAVVTGLLVSVLVWYTATSILYSLLY